MLEFSLSMKASGTIHEVLYGTKICVPAYQRSFSWESDRQIPQFLSDIRDYMEEKSEEAPPFYMGHFLFSKNGDEYFVIDGQQRLVSIQIFLAALFHLLKNIRPLKENEKKLYADLIGEKGNYHFCAVEYDDAFFKKCILEGNYLEAASSLNSLSKRRMLDAFCYFLEELKEKDEFSLLKYLEVVAESECTTHVVKDEEEAIRLFILQNDRGKLSTRLEIVKAQMLYSLKLATKKEDTLAVIKKVQDAFKKIYKLVSSVELFLDEDSVLLSAMSIQMNTISMRFTSEDVMEEIKKRGNADFVKRFITLLEEVFAAFKRFYEDKRYAAYSLSLLKNHNLLPFVAKAYLENLEDEERDELFASLESILLRHKIIGTRAVLEERLEDEFKSFSKKTYKDTVRKIESLEKGKKEGEWWWNFWRDSNYEVALSRELPLEITRHLLWKYENLLRLKGGEPYIRALSWEAVKIAVDEVRNGASGYGEVDEEYLEVYLNCLGNYILIRTEDKEKISREKDFSKRAALFTESFQSKEVKSLAKWSKERINERYERLLSLIVRSF